MPVPIYEREVKSLHWAEIQDAINYSNSKQIVGRIAEWRDKKTVGLTIRITPGLAVWFIRRREITLRLGLLSEIDLDKARYYAQQTRLAAGRKRNLREFVESLVKLDASPQYARYKDPQGVAEIADQLADETSLLAYRKRTGDTGATWTWKALTHEFLKYKKPSLKTSYHEQYEHYLTLPEFARVNDMPVSEVKLRDLEHLRDAITLNHAKSAVNRAVKQSKAMLQWAWTFHATAAGLDEAQDVWRRWAYEYKTNKRTREPSIEEIARTIVLAEKFRHLADGEHETYPGTIGALWGVALTAQRTGSFLRLRPDRLFDPPKQNRKLKGWKIANWTEEEMKGGRDGGRSHSLPLPPEVMKILGDQHKASGGESKWMFVGRDPKAHLTKSALNQLMYRLQGRVYDHTKKRKPARRGKPGPRPKPPKQRPNLFELYGIERWTLHDIRRAITTFLDDRRLGGAATAILGHKMDHDRAKERERMAKVTEQHYNRSQRIALKSEGMALWTRALLTAYRKELRKFRDVTGGRLAR